MFGRGEDVVVAAADVTFNVIILEGASTGSYCKARMRAAIRLGDVADKKLFACFCLLNNSGIRKMNDER